MADADAVLAAIQDSRHETPGHVLAVAVELLGRKVDA